MAGRARVEPDQLVVGRITKAHGTRGELLVMPMTDRPEDVFAEGRALWLADNEGVASEAPALVVVATRPFKRGLLVAFERIADRTGAEPFIGRYLLAPRSALEAPAEDEVYYHDLIGLRVETNGGGVIGTVRDVIEARPAALLDVEAAGRGRHLIPLTRPIVRRVDLDAGRIVIDPPAGLLEL